MTAPVIVLVGKTHTGKTTFGRLLKERVTNLIALETDTIAIFLREHFAEVAFVDDKEHTGKFEKVSLKFLLFKNIFERALEINAPLMLSNSNMWREGRRVLIAECKKARRPTVGVYFDLPIETLKERTEHSERDKRVLRTSRHFPELLERQESRMQMPDPSEFDEFHVVHSQDEYDSMLERLANKLSQ
ncbi:MAG: AAA family ATPase [Patescibacteria group bacterium]